MRGFYFWFARMFVSIYKIAFRNNILYILKKEINENEHFEQTTTIIYIEQMKKNAEDRNICREGEAERLGNWELTYTIQFTIENWKLK